MEPILPPASLSARTYTRSFSSNSPSNNERPCCPSTIILAYISSFFLFFFFTGGASPTCSSFCAFYTALLVSWITYFDSPVSFTVGSAFVGLKNLRRPILLFCFQQLHVELIYNEVCGLVYGIPEVSNPCVPNNCAYTRKLAISHSLDARIQFLIYGILQKLSTTDSYLECWTVPSKCLFIPCAVPQPPSIVFLVWSCFLS